MASGERPEQGRRFLRRRRPDSEPTIDVTDPVSAADERFHRLETALDDLEASGAVAVEVMRLLNQDEAALASVATVIEVDAVLTARVLALANSAAYAGPSTHRAPSLTAARAVVVVGAEALRSIAAQVATGGSGASVPAGYREHSAATAAGCVAAAAGHGLHRDAAFSLGLLHDIGWPILWSIDPQLRAATGSLVDTAAAASLERERFGVSHADAGAQLLEAWGFPADMTDAVAGHHGPVTSSSTPAAQLLAVGEALARLHLGAAAVEPVDPSRSDDVLALLGYSDATIEHLVDLTGGYYDDILRSVAAMS